MAPDLIHTKLWTIRSPSGRRRVDAGQRGFPRGRSHPTSAQRPVHYHVRMIAAISRELLRDRIGLVQGSN